MGEGLLYGMQRLTLYFTLTFLLLAGFLGWWWYHEYERERRQLQRGVRHELREHSLRTLLSIALVEPNLSLGDDADLTLRVREANGLIRPATPRDTVAGLGASDLEIRHVTRDTLISLNLDTQLMLDPSISEGDDRLLRTTVFDRHGVTITALDYRERRRAFGAADTAMLVQASIRRDRPLDPDRPTYLISGYRGRLLLTLLPQFLFGGLLLGATGLAFGTAYGNLRRRDRQLAARDALVANLAHELKTPIATVGVALEALGHFGAGADPVRRADYLDIGHRELGRLDRLADRTLATLQAEDAQLPLAPAPCDLAVLLRGAWDGLDLSDPRPGAELTLTATTPTTLVADAHYLHHLCHNLLDNARKYGGSPPRVTARLTATDDGDLLELTLSDNGPGIPPDERERVFRRFYRLPRPGHDVKGHGLGLAFVRQIARAHGGSIRVTAAGHLHLQLPRRAD